MQLDNDVIRQVAESVWTTTLGLDLTPAEPKAAGDEEREFLTGCVHIVGAWEGAAALHCSVALAKQAAAIMFDCEEPQPEEVRDALGELVNMTGGNTKALLPGPSTLSLPSIIDGKNHHVVVPGSKLLNQVELECQGEPLEILVMKASGTPQ